MNIFKCLTLVLLVFFANKSIANGADVYHDNWIYTPQCFEGSYTDNYGNFVEYKYCYEAKGTWHRVDTPSGNTIYKYKGNDNYTDNVSINGVENNYSSTSEIKYNYLFKNGDTHVVKDSSSYVYKSETSNYCVVYTSNYEFQFVNGDVIRQEVDFIAEPCN